MGISICSYLLLMHLGVSTLSFIDDVRESVRNAYTPEAIAEFFYNNFWNLPGVSLQMSHLKAKLSVNPLPAMTPSEEEG